MMSCALEAAAGRDVRACASCGVCRAVVAVAGVRPSVRPIEQQPRAGAALTVGLEGECLLLSGSLFVQY